MAKNEGQADGLVTCRVALTGCRGQVKVGEARRILPRLKSDPIQEVAATGGKIACRRCLTVIARAVGRKPEQVSFQVKACPGLDGEGCGEPTFFGLCAACAKMKAARAVLAQRYGTRLNGEPRPNQEVV